MKDDFVFDPCMLSDAATVAATRGRIMAVDFGDVRTGLAFSDPGRTLATGAGFIKPGGIAKAAEAVAAAAAERGAAAIVVGLPRNMDGTDGARADRCREFAGRVALLSGLPVMMTDERLTTVAASRFLNATDVRGRERRKVIDSLSAEIILQDTLEKLAGIGRS